MTTLDKNRILMITACLVTIPLIYYSNYTRKIVKCVFLKEEEEEDKKHKNEIAALVEGKEGSSSTKLKPPFPTAVRKLLSECRLAYLSTVDVEGSGSHLSLMRFTYVHDEDDGEVVIMSTNKYTKKFTMLQKQKGVALLVHDFEQEKPGGGRGSNSTGVFSITLNGNCRIVTNDKEDKYRQAHLNNNPDYPQFIIGKDIAILCVDVTSARICNINDHVEKWDVANAHSNTE